MKKNEPATALRRRRQALERQLPPLKAILRGSLIERYKRCGKPGCKCADGPGHGPKYYLSVSYPGLRPQMDYVPQESYAQIAEFVAQHARTLYSTLERAYCGREVGYGLSLEGASAVDLVKSMQVKSEPVAQKGKIA